MRIGVIEARKRMSELLRRAERGEVVVLMRRGKPIARLRAFPLPQRESDAALIRKIAAGAPFRF